MKISTCEVLCYRTTRRPNVPSLIPAASGRVPESLRDNLVVNTIAPPELVPRTAQQGPSRSNLATNSAATDRGLSSRATALSVAHGPVVNLVSDSDLRQTPESFHQEQGQPVVRHPDNTHAETETSPVAAPVAQGPQKSNCEVPEIVPNSKGHSLCDSIPPLEHLR